MKEIPYLHIALCTLLGLAAIELVVISFTPSKNKT